MCWKKEPRRLSYQAAKTRLNRNGRRCREAKVGRKIKAEAGGGRGSGGCARKVVCTYLDFAKSSIGQTRGHA